MRRSGASAGRVTWRQTRRIHISHAVFWISVLGVAGSVIGFLAGARVLMIPLIVFGITGLGGFAVFMGTVAPLALGRRPRRAPHAGRRRVR